MQNNDQYRTRQSSIMINLGSIVGALSIPCTLIWLLVKTTGTLNNIVLWSAPLFIIFAVTYTIWLSVRYRMTLVFVAPFILSVIIGFSVSDGSSLVIMFSGGLDYYSGALGIFNNPIFVTSLVAIVGCVYSLIKIKNTVKPHPIKIILTAIGIFYSIIITAIAAIGMIGFMKTDWF